MENTKQKYHNKYRIPSARADWHDYNGGAYFITICTKNREHFFGEIENGEMILSEIGEYADKNISEITQHNCYAEMPLWIVMPDHIHMVVIIDDTKTPHEKRAIDNGVETFPETSQYSNNVMKPQNSNKLIKHNSNKLIKQNSNQLMKSETFPETSQYSNNVMKPQNSNNVMKPQNSNKLIKQNSNQLMKSETFQETSLQGDNRMSRVTQMQSWLSVVIRQFKQSITRFARTTQPSFAWQERYYDRIIRNQGEINRIAEYIENNVAKWCEGKEID